MKILIITPFFPHASVHHAGGKFVYELIKHLYRRHDIYLFSRIEPHEIKFVKEMEALCKSIKPYRFKTPHDANPFKTLLITMSYLHLAVKANRIIRKENFDIVQVEYVETGLLIKRFKNTMMILDAHDVISKPAKRRYLSSRGYLQKASGWLKLQVIKRMEIYIAKKFDIIFTRSQIDKDILLNLDSNLKISVVPHLVEISKQPSNITREENVILFAGAMHRDVNIEAALFLDEKVLPMVQKEVKDVKLYIVGNNPPQRLKELAERDSRVEVTGFVQSILPYYQSATVFVTPLFVGGGIIAKNIEAMACSLPVVTTAIGNEGIGAVHGRDLLIAETPTEFAQAILYLLKNPEKREEIGKNGRKYVEKHFNIESVLGKIEEIYERL